MIIWRRYVRQIRRLDSTAVERIVAEKLKPRPEVVKQIVEAKDIIVRRQTDIPLGGGLETPQRITPTTPHNFTPLRPIPVGFSALDRAVREVPWESRFDILKRTVTPRYMDECRGTPIRQYMEGVVDGMRVRPVANPYVKLTKAKRYRLDTFPSRDWRRWTPEKVYVKGSRRRFDLPKDIAPHKDELGEWHPPRLSGRYTADIEKQYYMHELPWVWAKDFYHPPLHFMDREPQGPKRWYRKEFRLAKIREALRGMDALKHAYRKERRAAKRLSWFEQTVKETVGNDMASSHLRVRKIPKL